MANIVHGSAKSLGKMELLPGSVVPMEFGGTGATTAEQARINLGINTPSGETLPISAGGTGATTAERALINLGAMPAGTVPITAGGTGATTVDQAKANLGLDNVANYGISDSIDLDSSESYASSKAVSTVATVATAAEAAVAEKVDKSVVVDAEITTTWTGAAAPYTQTIAVTGVTPTSIQDIILDVAATVAEVEAWQALGAYDGGQAANQITLKTLNDKNTITIPIQVIVRGG